MKTVTVIKQIAKGVGLAGALGLIVIAPNAAVAFDKLVKKYNQKTKKGYNEYLKRSGYFTFEQDEDKFVIRLSEKGAGLFAESQLSDYQLSAGKWDGSWYLLMFDIPETHRNVRINIVRKLNELGMRQVQNSVYVHYLPTQELARRIRVRYPSVSSLVVSARVNEIDGQAQLKKAFNL
jgi:CRISPR-associated endonuclease Cas2